MEVKDEDLQLSTKYQSLMKKANNINQCNIDLYKKKFSDKVEINLFLNQKEVIKNLTLFKQDKALVLYELIKQEYNIPFRSLKLMLLKKGYLVYSIRHFILSMLLLILSIIGVIICFKLLLSFILIFVISFICVFSLYKVIHSFNCFYFNE